jgi:thioredoxin reductase
LLLMRAGLPVVVVGAGPVGLSAAIQLLDRKVEVIVVEASNDVAGSLRDWGHVRLFSPWRYNVDKTAARHLEAAGWKAPPPDSLPTGDELVRYYLRPLAQLPVLRDRIVLGRRVTAITRDGVDKTRTAGRADVPFLVRTDAGDILARAVIDASGTWGSPNPLGATGVPALGETALADRIHYGIPDALGKHRARYAGKTTLVVGAGHSAANSILALLELGAQSPGTAVQWATRSADLTRVFGGGDADGLPARGRLGAQLRAHAESGALVTIPRFRIQSLHEVDGRIEVTGTQDGDRMVLRGIDSIVAATGQRPDLHPNRELRLGIDAALECTAALGPLIDPNEHSCGTVRPHGARELAHPEPDFYIIGSKSYGRAPTFLLATGYEQARSVAAMIAGDEDAALRVELDLPETGVCKTSFAPADSAGCCRPATGTCC